MSINVAGHYSGFNRKYPTLEGKFLVALPTTALQWRPESGPLCSCRAQCSLYFGWKLLRRCAMKLKYFIAFCASAILLTSGCNGAPSVETGKLPQPVNVAMPTTTGDNSQLVAADALGRIGQPAVASLTSVLSDPDPVVRLQA